MDPYENGLGEYQWHEIDEAIGRMLVRLDKAVKKHPSWKGATIHEMILNVAEESGEVVKAANDMFEAHKAGKPIFKKYKQLVTELEQTAAVSLRALMALYKRIEKDDEGGINVSALIGPAPACHPPCGNGCQCGKNGNG